MLTIQRVYKPTAKALKKSGEAEKSDRYLFTDARTAVTYNSETLDIIEPFAPKRLDSFVEVTIADVPSELFMSSALLRMYDLADILKVEKQLKIKFTKRN